MIYWEGHNLFYVLASFYNTYKPDWKFLYWCPWPSSSTNPYTVPPRASFKSIKLLINILPILFNQNPSLYSAFYLKFLMMFTSFFLCPKRVSTATITHICAYCLYTCIVMIHVNPKVCSPWGPWGSLHLQHHFSDWHVGLGILVLSFVFGQHLAK